MKVNRALIGLIALFLFLGSSVLSYNVGFVQGTMNTYHTVAFSDEAQHLVSVTTTGPGPVTIYYGIPSTGTGPTLVNSTTISGYLAVGNYIGLIFAPYILLLGDMFGGLMMLAIMMPLYNKTQSLDYCLIVWVLLSAALTAALPLMTYRLSYVFLILGVASLLYRMLVPRG